MKPFTIDDALRDAQAALLQLKRWGWKGFDCSDSGMALLKSWNRPVAPASVPETIEAIAAEIADCRRCRLWAGRRTIVFGEGAPKARVVFLGFAPGAEEDQGGRPFMGPDGQLLTRIIEAMKLTREQVYLCNLVKCRPAQDRLPDRNEIDCCRTLLRRQLAVIKPEVICVLGASAAQALLDTEASLEDIRGRFHDLEGVKVMPTYHPEDLLRRPDRKRDVWEDVKKVMAYLRIPID